jgi:hypothetical protein
MLNTLSALLAVTVGLILWLLIYAISTGGPIWSPAGSYEAVLLLLPVAGVVGLQIRRAMLLGPSLHTLWWTALAPVVAIGNTALYLVISANLELHTNDAELLSAAAVGLLWMVFALFWNRVWKRRQEFLKIEGTNFPDMKEW